MRPSACLILILSCSAGAFQLSGADPAATSGDPARGLVLYNQCAVCHRDRATDVPNPGPELRGVVGRQAAGLPGYRYSRALRNLRRPWTEAELDAFIADPQAAVPGNTMPFPGMTEESQRRDLIAYLKTLKRSSP